MKTRVLLITLALILAVAVVPGFAKSSNSHSHSAYGGDVMGYMFGTESPVFDWGTPITATFCWEPDPSKPGLAAEKYSFEVYGTLEFSFGTADPVMEEVDFSFGTYDTCYDLDIENLATMVEQWLWDEYGYLPGDVTGMEVLFSAKVKGLDPHRKTGKKRQDNVWSDPIEDFLGISWGPPL